MITEHGLLFLFFAQGGLGQQHHLLVFMAALSKRAFIKEMGN